MSIRLKKSKKKNKFRFSSIKAPFKNERNHKKAGFIFLLISTYLLIACISFFSNWKKDFDIVSKSLTEALINTEIVVDNSLGKFGAFISHWLIFQGFGISSFIIVILLFLIGLKLLKINTLPIRKSILHGLTAMVWLSVFFGHFFESNLILGGGVGFQCNIWLYTMLGAIGIKLLLFIALIVIWFPSIKVNLKFLKNFILKLKPTALEEKKEIIAGSIENKEEDLINTPPEIKVVEAEAPDKPTEKKKEDFDIEVSQSVKEEMLSEKEIKKKLEDLGDYDPTLELSEFKMPGIDLLKDYGDSEIKIDKDEESRINIQDYNWEKIFHKMLN